MKNIIRMIIISTTVAFLGACTQGSAETTDVAQAHDAPVAEPVATNTSAVASRDIDPCALMAPAAIASAFGELKEGPFPSSGLRNERQCNYTNMQGSWLKLSVYEGEERWEWERNITNAQNPRDLSGLGDEAFAIKRGTDAVVYSRKNNDILELSCSCPFEVAERIARAAIPQL
jgi:hypothetical protein